MKTSKRQMQSVFSQNMMREEETPEMTSSRNRLSRVAVAAAAVLILSTAAMPALAANGDFGQPVSTGSTPTASDALATLRAAVAIAPCDIAMCDVDGSCGVTASDALRVLTRSTGQDIELLSGSGRGVGSAKLVRCCGDEILVVTTLQNRFKHVPH